MRTIIVSDLHYRSKDDETKREKFVLMHGYAGAGPLFFPILKVLVKHFDVILVDMIGQGGSSRPNDYDYENISPEESNIYFVQYIEKWRKSMKRIIYLWENQIKAASYARLSEQEIRKIKQFDDFILSGHSFGGYLTAIYTCEYP